VTRGRKRSRASGHATHVLICAETVEIFRKNYSIFVFKLMI
jgi:hypothetical protein